MSTGLLDIQRALLPGYLRARQFALDEERRRGARFRAVATEALLGWWEKNESCLRSARLVNISRGGALVIVAQSPRELEPVSFSLLADRTGRWLESRVVGVAAEPPGQFFVHLTFEEPCPDDIFVLALGLAKESNKRDENVVDKRLQVPPVAVLAAH
jgi:hypothetical protein